MAIYLKIGGYTIRLHEAQQEPLFYWPLWPFDLFQPDSDEPPDIRMEITVTEILPDIAQGRLLFDACQGLWKLYESESGYVLESLRPADETLYTRSIISRDYSQVDVWVLREEQRAGWTPITIINPIMELCLNSKLALEGGLLLHAAGLLTERGVWVFTGPSGAGKSTLSDFFAPRGNCVVLNDERIILRKIDDEFVVFGTPWSGTSRIATNREGLLQLIYCIHHGSDVHAVRSLSPHEAVPLCLQQCFLPHWDREALDRMLGTVSELIEQKPCLDLAFLKRPDVVEYLYEQSQRTVLPQVPDLV
jgi:hypothetical protein